MRNIRKKLIGTIVGASILLYGFNMVKEEGQRNEVLIMKELDNGDAKLSDNFIITSRGTMTLIDKNTHEIYDLGIVVGYLV